MKTAPLFLAASIAAFAYFTTSPSACAIVAGQLIYKATSQDLAVVGAPVPGAGEAGCGIPAGAVWSLLGDPATNDAGGVAFVATIRWPKIGSVPAGSSAKLFVRFQPDQRLVPLASAGDLVVAGATGKFHSFKAPLIAPDGTIACLAVTGEWDTAPLKKPITALIVSQPVHNPTGDTKGPIEFVARTGAPVSDAVEAPTLSSIDACAVESGGCVAFRGKFPLQPGVVGVPVVKVATAYGFRSSGRPMEMMTLNRTTVPTAAGSTASLKSFSTIVAGPTTAGAGRGWLSTEPATGAVWFTATGTFSDGTTKLLARKIPAGNEAAALVVVASTGQAEAPAGSTNFAATIGIPSWSWGAHDPVSTGGGGAATPTPEPPDPFAYVTKKGSVLVVSNIGSSGLDGSEITLPVGTPLSDGSTVTGVKSCVISTYLSKKGYDYYRRTAGTPVATPPEHVLGWQVDTEPPTVCATVGGQAADCPPGAVWKSFTSMAIRDGGDFGMLFTATLKQGLGGVDKTNDAGLWSVDSRGGVHLLTRKGGLVILGAGGGPHVKAFKVLTTVAGTPGELRSCDQSGGVVLQITDDAGKAHIVEIDETFDFVVGGGGGGTES